MAQNFTAAIHYEGKSLLAVVVPALRKDGMHYEVNIPGYHRFFVKWSVLDRYDIINGAGLNIPDALILAVSDVIEKQEG
jgi:hypothetical protein